MTDQPTPPPLSPVDKAFDALPLDTLKDYREKMAQEPGRPDLKTIDAALARRNEPPIDAERRDDFTAHGMSEQSRAANYRPDLRRYAGNEAISDSLKDLSASLNLSGEYGSGLGSRLAEVMSRLDAMPREEWENWARDMDRVTLRVVGDQQGYDALVRQAKAALARSGTDVAKKLANHIMLKDPILLRMLANTQSAYERLAAKYKSTK